MSNTTNCPCNPSADSDTKGFGSTLTGGIQDVAAFLPIIGTEQCEKHVGSALDGGYLYASATILSIFGSLGILKNALSILFASISVAVPWLSRRDGDRWPSISWHLILGANAIGNAGFEPAGSVAPLIALEGKGKIYQAEKKLMEILEEKHIDDANKVTIQKSLLQWNIGLVGSALLAGAASLAPYFYPISTLTVQISPSPWLYPVLRSGGSLVACVAIQFILQHRIISLMKNRLIFITLEQAIIAPLNETWWSDTLPAELCLWNLQGSFESGRSWTEYVDVTRSDGKSLREIFDTIRKKHFRRSHFSFLPVWWCVLLIAAVAIGVGYVGCFTLVSNTSSDSNAPLAWLGAEFALAIVRIILWAWDPELDNCTEISLRLDLLGDHPPVTASQTKPVSELHDTFSLPLTPEKRFLENMTPYTGPLDRFQLTDNTILYFSLISDSDNPTVTEPKNANVDTSATKTTVWNVRGQLQRVLYMTIWSLESQSGFTLVMKRTSISEVYMTYYDVSIGRGHDQMTASLGSKIERHQVQTAYHARFCDQLEEYYVSLLQLLLDAVMPRVNVPTKIKSSWQNFFRRRRVQPVSDPEADNTRLGGKLAAETTTSPVATLVYHWNLRDMSYSTRALPLLSANEIEKQYRLELKSNLIRSWEAWISTACRVMLSEVKLDDPFKHPKYGGVAQSRFLHQLGLRELALAHSSLELEHVLEPQWQDITKNFSLPHLHELWLKSKYFDLRQTRVQEETRRSNERLESFRTEWMEFCRKNIEEGTDVDESETPWNTLRQLVNSAWEGGNRPWEDLERPLLQMTLYPDADTDPWTSIFRNEYQKIQKAIEKVRNKSNEAYQYPTPDPDAWRKFVLLSWDDISLELASATVFFLSSRCTTAEINAVIAKPTTRSVIGVPTSQIPNITPNSHLLYLGDESEEEIELDWIKQNRQRLLDSGTGNHFTFHLSPSDIYLNKVHHTSGTIAHLTVALERRSRLRLWLLHSRYDSLSVWIRYREKRYDIPSERIPAYNEGGFKWKSFDLKEEFEPGRVDFYVNAVGRWYFLRDIFVEFLPLNADPTDPNTKHALAKEEVGVLECDASRDSHAGLSKGKGKEKDDAGEEDEHREEASQDAESSTHKPDVAEDLSARHSEG